MGNQKNKKYTQAVKSHRFIKIFNFMNINYSRTNNDKYI